MFCEFWKRQFSFLASISNFFMRRLHAPLTSYFPQWRKLMDRREVDFAENWHASVNFASKENRRSILARVRNVGESCTKKNQIRTLKNEKDT